jgi:hypothetical protein
MKRALGLWLVAIFGILYSTFVLEQLWNWFVAPLGISPISYWHMFGLTLMVQVLVQTDSFYTDKRWNLAILMLNACVPADRKAELDAQIEADNKNVWFEAGWDILAKRLVNGTSMLAIGWVIHVLAM